MSEKPLSSQIAALRDDLLRFAQRQLSDPALAEDVVHETIDAALAKNTYSGKGSLKSWLFAILRNKIVDQIRQQNKLSLQTYSEDEPIEADSLFTTRGYWKKSAQPANWQHPEAMLDNQQFWTILEICLNQLPENTSRVFMMREHLGLSIQEICHALSISENNCWVIMHRARQQLRLCLERKYFASPTGETDAQL